MKLSYQWLREWVDFTLTPEALAQQLTLAGLEVDSCSPVADDVVLDIQLTPNRGDCLSIAGIAREVSALNNIPIKAKKTPVQPVTIQKIFPVKLDASDACLYYTGRVIENVRNDISTPPWIQERLQRADTKCISPIVDITNYVMIELGNPLHAFDLNTLHNEIIVRKGKKGEELVLLDNQAITLDEDVLIIADSKKPVALAGIMGGLETSITTNTSSIFIESAFFSPNAILGRQRRYGISTDGAQRFERGVDPYLPIKALERVTELVLEICGGNAGPVIEAYLGGKEAYAENLAKLFGVEHYPAIIALPKSQPKRLLGIEIPEQQVRDILTSLGMTVHETQDAWQVQASTYRFDMRLPEDVIEEIARVYGYANIPAKLPSFGVQKPFPSQGELSGEKIAKTLISRGYHEVITYSFIDPTVQQLCEPDAKPITLLNPISADMSVMRTSLLPGLLNVVQYNQNRQQDRIRCFEHGLCFIQTKNGLDQRHFFAGIICGSLFPEQWRQKAAVDFYHIKSDVEAILALTNYSKAFTFEAKPTSLSPCYHPNKSAVIFKDKKLLGYIGAIHPRILQAMGIKGEMYAFELKLDEIKNIAMPRFKPLPRFPAVRRDIAFILDDKYLVEDIRRCVQELASHWEITGILLKSFTVFDVYQGKNIPAGKKSIAVGLTLQHQERTLTDLEIEEKIKEVMFALKKQFDAELRI